MHPDLERIVAEDEIGRAAVDVATAEGHTRIEAARHEIAASRQASLSELERQLTTAIAAIERDTDAEVDRRRTRRTAFERERVAAGRAALDDAADLFVSIVRDGPTRGSSP